MFLAALFVLGVLSGATAAVVGFGIGSLLTPLLLTRLSPAAAVAVVAIPHLLATAVRFVRHRRFVDRAVLLRFGLPSAAGGLTGAMMQNWLPERGLFMALGLLLIATSAANLTGGYAGWTPGRRLAAILGWFSGLFGGLVGNQGGLRAAGLLAFDLSPRAYLATGTVVALMVDAARTPIYLLRSSGELLSLATPIAVASAGCLLGTVIGEKLFLGLPPERYRKIIGAAVGALGIWLLARVV